MFDCTLTEVEVWADDASNFRTRWCETEDNTRTRLAGAYKMAVESCTLVTFDVNLNTNTPWREVVDFVSIALMVSQRLAEDVS